MPRQSATLRVVWAALDNPFPTPELKEALQDWLTMTGHPDRLKERDVKRDSEFVRGRSGIAPHRATPSNRKRG